MKAYQQDRRINGARPADETGNCHVLENTRTHLRTLARPCSVAVTIQVAWWQARSSSNHDDAVRRAENASCRFGNW
jgi:hypothetical protein